MTRSLTPSRRARRPNVNWRNLGQRSRLQRPVEDLVPRILVPHRVFDCSGYYVYGS